MSNIKEALQWLNERKKIRARGWLGYFCLSDWDGGIIDEKGEDAARGFFMLLINDCTWEVYKETSSEKKPNLDFSDALKCLKGNHKLRRKGWNGKNLSVSLFSSELDQVEKHFRILDASKNIINVWVPSISDILANDWEIVE